MKRMAEAKERYDKIPIPEELSKRVMLEVDKADRKRRRNMAKIRRRRSFAGMGAAVAAAAVLFTAGVNTSQVFAKEVGKIPVIGSLARIVTFRSYETKTEEMEISVEIPSVEMIAEDLKGLEAEINEEIHDFCKEYADQAVQRAEEYKQAFLDTGGTQEEWEEHNIAIKVWYEVKSHTDQYLSLMIMGTESWTSAYSETRYITLDLQQGTWITLADLLGEDYAQIARESILGQIQLREKESGMKFWTEDWEGVTSDTGFYVNQTGNPVVVLEKYEIAPGAAGEQEFEIVPGDFKEQKPRDEQDAAENQEDGDGQEARSGQESASEAEIFYEDNFAVDEEAVVRFAGLIQEAVAKRDVEGLADLTDFPVYVGISEEGLVVENREDFVALGAEKLLTDEMADSIENTDLTSLNPSMAGFTMYATQGAPSITFGVRDGRLAISGMNY